MAGGGASRSPPDDWPVPPLCGWLGGEGDSRPSEGVPHDAGLGDRWRERRQVELGQDELAAGLLVGIAPERPDDQVAGAAEPERVGDRRQGSEHGERGRPAGADRSRLRVTLQDGGEQQPPHDQAHDDGDRRVPGPHRPAPRRGVPDLGLRVLERGARWRERLGHGQNRK